MFDEQDMRRMGGLVNFLPFTYLAVVVGSLAIMGFPFLTGFYSKDLVLELAYSRYLIDASFVHFLGVGAAFFTSVYSIRLLLFVFFFSSNSFRSFFSAHESEGYMLFSMSVLLLASIFVGYLFSDVSVGWGTFLWNNSLFLLPSHFNHLEADFISPFVKNLPLLVSLFGFFIGTFSTLYFSRKSFISSSVNPSLFNQIWSSISAFFSAAGYFNAVYNRIFLIFFNLSYISANKYLDKGWLELLGPFGLYKVFRSFSSFLRANPPSIIFFSVGYMFFSLVFFTLFLFLHSQIFIFLALNQGLVIISLLMLLGAWLNK